MAQLAQVQHGTYDEEFDYDLFPLGTAGLALGTTSTNISNIVPDGYTLKVARLTITNKATVGLITLQIIATGAGVVNAQGLATQTIFTYEVGSTASVQFSEDDFEFTVPAGFQLSGFCTGATMDVTGAARYLRGSFT